MTVGVTLEFPAMTTDQYDRVCGLMGLTPRGAGPGGMLFHWAAVEGDGMYITDVWDSRERFETFARNRIGPLSQAVGVAAPPRTTFDEVHSHLTAGKLDGVIDPVAVVMEFEGDIHLYDDVLDLMGLTPRQAGPDGALFHWATAIEGVIRVTDLWQDLATFDAFADTHIAPYSAKVRFGAPESVVAHEVYNYFTAGS